jgi:hypothetical protein
MELRDQSHEPLPGATCIVRQLRIHLLCPFDLDFEPDVERLAREDVSVARVQPGPGGPPAVEIPRAMKGAVTFGGEVVAGEAAISARVYRFGTGIVRLTFVRDAWDLASLARLSARAEDIQVDGKAVVQVARELGAEIRQRLRPYARASYETLLEATEAYPIIHVGSIPGDGPRGDAFVDENRRVFAAIVGGDARRGSLSHFALAQYPIESFGAVAGDVVAIREAGAFLHLDQGARGGGGAPEIGADTRRIDGLIELTYAQYWSLRSVDDIVEHLQDEAYEFISRLQQGGAIVVPLGEVLRRLYRAREEHMAISNVVDDFLELPAIGFDIYIDAVFRRVQDTFGVVERSRRARDRLEDLEQSYEVVHAIISERRLFTIELLVLLVIVLELLLALWK